MCCTGSPCTSCAGRYRDPARARRRRITAASFFLNAVFAFAIARPGPSRIRPAFTEARSHLAVVVGSGAAVGICLGLSIVVFVRWGLWWFAISLSIVIAVMMICYVAVPSRLIGMKTTYSKRDKLTATAVGGAIGAVVCTPPYVLGRVGIHMLGSHTLFIPGIFVLVIGLTLQAGATGAVKAIEISANYSRGTARVPAAKRYPVTRPARRTTADGAGTRSPRSRHFRPTRTGRPSQPIWYRPPDHAQAGFRQGLSQGVAISLDGPQVTFDLE